MPLQLKSWLATPFQANQVEGANGAGAEPQLQQRNPANNTNFFIEVLQSMQHSQRQLIEEMSQLKADKTCWDIFGTCQNICYVKLVNSLTKRILLVIGQIQDVFNTSINKNSNLGLKPCKSVQESSEEVLFIRSQQIARQMYLSRFNM